MAKQLPLVIVLGATACGKSRLAIELARRFKGEIISADSMQVYQGLDIVTNKVTEDEQDLAKHHMINVLDPLHRYSIVDFRNKALETIDTLFEINSLPIVVGGTNYWIESLIWKSFLVSPNSTTTKRSNPEEEDAEETSTLIDSEAEMIKKLDKSSLHNLEDFEDVDKFFAKPIYNEGFKGIPNDKLWAILEQVDQESAHLFHPNDKRRVIRALQVIQAKQKSYSGLLRDMNKTETEDKGKLGGPLRYNPTCVLWLSCEQEILDKILDKRVDDMLDRGLLAELENFHDRYNRKRLETGAKPDYEKGIFQTIGFKEFHNYLLLEPDEKETENGNKVLKKSIEDLKCSTKRYARKQIRWIRRRFLHADTRDLPPIFKLTTSFDEEGWQDQVQKPTFEIITSLIEGKPFDEKILNLQQSSEKKSVTNNPAKFHCQACDMTLIGSYYVGSHLSSKHHEKNVSYKKRLKQSQTEFSGADPP